MSERALTVVTEPGREDLAPAVGQTLEEWGELLSSLGEAPYRARQVFRWIHQRGELEPTHMSDLPAALREKLQHSVTWQSAELARVARSLDGTRKLLLRLADGKQVECVLIPMSSRPDSAGEEAAKLDPAALDLGAEESTLVDQLESVGEGAAAPRQRVTLCLSTQVGCAMGCVFCASGRAGLKRGLRAHEIVVQALLAQKHLEPSEYVRNIVFMGMGEPLHHYEETSRAIRLLTHADGLNVGLRRITVSTVGLVPGIRRLASDFQGKVGLAISLHAPSDELRSRLVPINERYPLAELIGALRAYPLPARRRITIEYTLINGINDSVNEADQLAIVLRDLRVKVNLIPMNEVAGSGLGGTSLDRVEAFRERLAEHRVSCSVRGRKGDDVDAACGQLALETA